MRFDSRGPNSSTCVLVESLKKHYWKKNSNGYVDMIDENVGLANFIIRVIFQSIVVIMSI